MNVLYPVFALIGWTSICYLRLGLSRRAAARKGEVDPKYYKLYQDGGEPEHLRVQSRHVQNLLEAPMLFYIICIMAYQTGQSDQLVVAMAWIYVLLRLAHSYVHLRTNIVLRRFKVFALSMLVLTTLWAIVLVGVVQS